ncbi:hypothetical protein [Peterkaempfera griseoplana]|uniref:hypothetical protein n=1 Tax=Peterkaempfera griseoplana TaxID=66896 RepID=UPI0006E35F6A|nr:hypothetical protein [Peterkaempfera griseoplana]
MSRSLRNGAIAALVLAIAPLSACAASNDAATLQVQPDNAATSIGDNLRLNNILLVTRGAGAAETETRPAAVSVNISNSGSTAEVLKAITVGDAGTAELVGPDGARVPQITIPAGGSLLLGGPGQPRAQVPDATVQEGGYAKVTFGFDAAGTVTTQAAVVTGRGDYAPFAPTAPSTPTAPPTGAATGAAAGAGATNPQATGTATATAGTNAAGTSTAGTNAAGTSTAGHAVHRSGSTATAGAGASATAGGATGGQG